MTTQSKQPVVTQIYQLHIRATPAQLWEAITTPQWTRRYGYRAPSHYELHPGGAFRGLPSDEMKSHGAPEVLVDGEVLAVDAPRRLEQTWRFLADPTSVAEGFTHLTWTIDGGEDGLSKLTVIHELDGAPNTAAAVAGEVPGAGGGWSFILSDLKTLLETGSRLSN